MNTLYNDRNCHDDDAFSRIWPLSEKGRGEANDIGGGSQQQLLSALRMINWENGLENDQLGLSLVMMVGTCMEVGRIGITGNMY